jgi:glycine hydroxymethyltransferase
MEIRKVVEVDPEVGGILDREVCRQGDTLNLIASENYASLAVLEASASVFTNKYAEGYPGRRYYGGCEEVDRVESVARDRACRLFGADHANVQPHAGAAANLAVYFACLKPGDRILGMNLAHGGHLTHGHPLSISGAWFEVDAYGVDKKTETIDYNEVEKVARSGKPRLIVAGASAYSRVIDWERLRRIADGVGALLMADIAHYAGLIAVGLYPSPVPWADFVTCTTHKTLRGPRGGLILCRQEHAKAINKGVFPGIQGGPLIHSIAAKAVALHEASQDSFRDYQQQTLNNARHLAARLQEAGFRIVSGGTDCHMFLVDLTPHGQTGKEAEAVLSRAGLIVNKNAIPFDPHPPLTAGGIRVGTPALTTRGMREEEMDRIAEWIRQVLLEDRSEERLREIRSRTRELCDRFPLYPELRRAGSAAAVPAG